MKLGPTNAFPRGKFSADDEGGLQLGMAVIDRTLIIDVGKPVAWIGLDYHTAVQLAEMILKRAHEIKPEATG